MSLVADIAATWRDPGGMVGRWLATGVREDRALAMIMGAGLVTFLARIPVALRAALLDPAVPLAARLGTSLFVCLFLMPLIAYALALVLHLLAGGRGQGAYGARLALFWALLAIAPAMLLQGLAEGFLGQVLAVKLTGLAVFLVFLWFVLAGLRAAYGAHHG